MSARIPLSTYRLQFGKHLTFGDLAALVPYLDRLGVDACYTSPCLKATSGTAHRYDICDHDAFNPELGGAEGFAARPGRSRHTAWVSFSSRADDGRTRASTMITATSRRWSSPSPTAAGRSTRVWADDLHHQLRRATAGDTEGYYADFTGSTECIAATIRQGWFYTGQPVMAARQPRGSARRG